MLKKRKVLVVSPHPDDETLGCGGALLRHKNKNDKTYWLQITDINVNSGWPKDIVEKRKDEIETVARAYGFSGTFNLKVPTTKVDSVPFSDLARRLSSIFKKLSPNIIYIPFIYDVHTDHQLIAKISQSLLKWFRYPNIRKVYMYETPSETEFNFLERQVFRPNVFIDISKYMNEKIEIMKIYESEMGKHPFPRSEKTIRALAQFRGSQSGFNSAEAFELVYERKR